VSIAQVKAALVLSDAEHQVLTGAVNSINTHQSLQARQALQVFNEERHSKYAHALSWQILGNLAFSEKNWTKANQHYQQSLSYSALPHRDRQSIQAKLMQANYQLKDWQRSIDHWLLWNKMLVKGSPQAFSAQDYLRASWSYKGLGQWKAAKKALLKAMSMTLEPTLSGYQSLLVIERGLGDVAAQITVLKQLLKLAPTQQVYWLTLATLYENSGSKAQAITLLYSAFENGVLQSSEHIKLLASGLSQRGNPAAASKVIELAIERQYLQSAKSSQLLVHFYSLAKMFTKAINVLQQTEPSDIKHLQLARLYYQNKQWQLAYSSAQKIPVIDQKHVIEMELLMALCSLHLKREERANLHFYNMLIIDPKHLVAKAALRHKK